jgi:hypothetical protein
MAESGPGPGVDAKGYPVIDPTQNVLDLVTAAIKRQDDLREAESRHMREIAELRSKYDKELRESESARIDAIRAVDVGAVNRAAEVSATQATILANQVASSAEALRIALAAALEPIQKDIADLRKTQYEQAGQRAQVGESRLNIGAILGGFSVVLVLVFGIITLVR